MRMVAALFLIPLLFDVTPAGSLKKLAEKNSYAFKVQTQVDGKLGPNERAVWENIEGVFQKPDVLVAKGGKDMKMVRKGKNALYLEGTDWKEEKDVERKNWGVFRHLVGLMAPHDEIAMRASTLPPLKVTLDVDGVTCDVFKAEFTKQGAQDLAKDLLNNAKEPNWGPRGRVGGTPIQPKDAKGNIKLMIDPEKELPRQLALEVTFTASFQVRGGKMEEREITIVRTVTLSEFDKAEPQIPDEVKKKLGIGDK